jgi:hypothetical protein
MSDTSQALSDIELTWDNSSLKIGVNQATNLIIKFESDVKKKFEETTKGQEKIAKQQTGNIKEAVFGALAKFAFIGIAIKGAIGALRQFIGEIPEIGKTFEIAKGIIMKNLLWPLRQELIPILQKFLNWVRDHRTMFVQWGVVIRNIFVTIKTFLTMVWDFAKNFAKGLIKSLGIKDFTEMINMALLKITAVFIFLDDLLSPFFKSFGAGVGEVIKFVKELADAFVKGFGNNKLF